MSTNLPVQVIERQDWLEPLAERLQTTLAATLDGPVGPKVADVLHGTWLGHPLHVVLTDVPIGSWVTAAVLDALEAETGSRAFRLGADTAIKIGLLGSAASAMTGLADWSKIGGGRARRVGLVHGLLNTTAALCYVTSLFLRNNHSRRAGRQWSLLGLVVSGFSAYLGGHLVYNEKLGVDHTAGDSPPDDFTAVLPEAELPDNTLRRVEVNGMRVLLARKNGNIYAIAETCSHMGGPLAEGKLEDDSVRCPWHGSCFSLTDGRVLEGPAVHAQPLLETRIVDGQIEVRGADAARALMEIAG